MNRRRLSVWNAAPDMVALDDGASLLPKRRTVRQDLKPSLLLPKAVSRSNSSNMHAPKQNDSLESQIFVRSSFKLASIYEMHKVQKRASSGNLLADDEPEADNDLSNVFKPILSLVYWHHHLMGFMLIAQYLSASLNGPFIYVIAYFIIAGVTCDLGKYLTGFSRNPCLFVYLSIMPQFLFEYLSVKSSFESLFWFIGINAIICQTDRPAESWDSLVNLALFNSIHILAALIHYSPSLCSPSCLISQSSWIELALIFLISCWLCTLFHILQRVIRLNAFAQVEREKYMKTLIQNNQELKRQLRSFVGRKDAGDNTSPLERVITLIKELVSKCEASLPGLANTLLDILGDLSSNSLLQPQLLQNGDDDDIRDWLTDMLAITQYNMSRSSEEDSENNVASFFHIDFEAALDIEVKEYLEKFPSHDFDVLHLDKLSKGHALYYLVLHLFITNDIDTKLSIPSSILMTWALVVEKNYKASNSYHNSLHAADVVQSMLFFLSKDRVKKYLNVEELTASIVACAFHDYRHPGVNNSFLIATNNPLAQRYNDQSILENYHCASLYEILSDAPTNIFLNCNSEQKKYMRDLIIGMIMSTDMSLHYDSIGKFKSKMNGSGINMDNRSDRKLFLNTAIKCADINNSTKPLDLSRIWCHLIMQEFFAQGAEEKLRNLPISPFMDPSTTDVPKCQVVN
jgi:hypothetical protein